MRGLWGPSIEAFYRRGLLERIAAAIASRGCARPVEPADARGRRSARAGRPLRGHPVRPPPHRCGAVDVSTAGPVLHPARERDGAPRARARRSRDLRRRRDPTRPRRRRLRDVERRSHRPCRRASAFARACSWVATAAAARSASKVASSSSAPIPSSRDIRSTSTSPTRRNSAWAGKPRRPAITRRRSQGFSRLPTSTAALPIAPSRSRASTCKRCCGACPTRT